ncbi:MAG TPA: hypothetical protein VIP11_10765 [Gemmatimonadaceae bacterium]
MTARFADDEPGLPIEQFIQAITSQLDRAQTALALKARAGIPLTFAVKDLTLDLRAHIDMTGSVVRIRPAGPGDVGGSMLRIALTTITRPTIEENTPKFALAADEPGLREAVGDQLNEDELRRLEWAGVRTVSQLADLEQHAGSNELERVAQVPALRLRAALEQASRPFVNRVSTFEPPVSHHDPERSEGEGSALPSSEGRRFELLTPRDNVPATKPALLRIDGHNLVRDVIPKVRIGGEAVPVLQATKRSLVIAPLAHQMGGTIEIETSPGVVVSHELASRGGA